MKRRNANGELRKAEFPYITMFLDSMGSWIERNITPEFMDFKRKQISHTLAGELDHELDVAEAPTEFVFSQELEKERALIMSFLYLYQSGNALAQCEYYFRRFAFKSLQVSRDEHLRNMCGLYFSIFYVVKIRLKVVLNNLKTACPGCKADVGALIKMYDRKFDQELRERNSLHHAMPFEDLNMDRIYITRAMSLSKDLTSKGWDKEHLSAYCRSSKEWAKRVRRRSDTVMVFIEVVAKLIMDAASFLQA